MTRDHDAKLGMVQGVLADLFEEYPDRTFTELEAILGVELSDYIYVQAPLLDPAEINGLIVEIRGRGRGY